MSAFFEWLFLSQSNIIWCSDFLIFFNFPDLEAFPMPQPLRSRIRPSSIRQRPWWAAEPRAHTRWPKRIILIDAHVGGGGGEGSKDCHIKMHQKFIIKHKKGAP